MISVPIQCVTDVRRQMIELVGAGRTPEELAKEFEPSAQAIRNWVAQVAEIIGVPANTVKTRCSMRASQ